jgi:hypothetical protein
MKPLDRFVRDPSFSCEMPQRVDKMNLNESVENVIQGLFGDLNIHECTYDNLAEVTGRWVKFAEQQSSNRDWDISNPGGSCHLDRISRLVAFRHIAEFRSRVRARSAIEIAVLELFLLSRIRTYVLAYLSVQEGEDFEGLESYESRVPLFISQLLRNLGRRSNCTLNLGYKWLRLRIDIDPLVHLRKMYGLMLLRERRGPKTSWVASGLMAIHKTGFLLKSKLVVYIAKIVANRLASHDDHVTGITSLLRTKAVRRFLATCIMILFPSARELIETDWLDLLTRIEEFFVPRLPALLKAMPHGSINNHGFIKLCKVAFGTIAGRTSVRNVHEINNIDFIFNTLRVAYSWGVTYPLVDNLLDSAATTEDIRAQLSKVLSDLFAGNVETYAVDGHKHLSINEVHQRLSEVISLVPPGRLPQARRILGHLLESHRRDSKRRLSTLGPNGGSDIRREVMVDTALKAALVRLATMEICGIAVDEEVVARNLVRSLFNQLGDDLWDIYEDFDDDRVTPYTLFLTQGGTPNPFDFYYDYSVLLAQGLSKRRQVAVFIGFCETLRDSLLTLKERKSDLLGVSAAVSRTLERVEGGSLGQVVCDIPHVDFDAVLFAFENAVLENCFRSLKTSSRNTKR